MASPPPPQQAEATSGASESSGKGGNVEFLVRVTDGETEAISLDQVMSWCTGDGTERLVELRVMASKAAVAGRLDLVRHFVEEQNVAVNTIFARE